MRRDSTSMVARSQTETPLTWTAARVSGFDPAQWIAPMKLRRMDTTGPYALVAMRQREDFQKFLRDLEAKKQR
jgi:hypothetical protein